jgi:hypothetical protein
MKNYINLQADRYIRYIIEDYIYETFLDAPNKHKDKLIELTIELYFYLENKGETTQIKSKKLKDKWRIMFLDKKQQYTFLLNILESTNLLTRDKSYSTGKSYYSDGIKHEAEAFCKTIKLTDITDNILKDDIEYQLNIERIYEDVELKNKEYWIELYKSQENIINMIYETYYDINEVKTYLYSIRGKYTKKGKLIDDILINRYINRAIKYNNKIFNFNLTDEGRFYNPTTYQPSTIRHLLKYNGEYLVELDIKNSQPLLLNNFINNQSYKEAVESGIFYDILEKELNKDREVVKIMTMKYIFFNNKPLKGGALYKAMEKHFKGTIEQINKLKKDNLLWKVLQSAESEIFIGELTGNYISIHDGILIKKSDIDVFYNKLMDLYNERKLKPTIKIN